MSKNLLAAALVALSWPAFSQSLHEAIRKTDHERVEEAARDFRAIIARDPSKGENYFYYGENYFKSGDIDSARIMYTKGTELNATYPLNYVGLGKVLLSRGDANAARTQFYKAASLSGGKNAEVMRQTAEAWLATDNKNADEAITQANAAIKIDPKNAENYILLGDAQLEKNPSDGSTPIKSYQMASKLDPKSPKGLLRQGRLYQRARNYNLALDFYKKAIELDPKFAPAYREIAELYSLAGQPANSIENWKKYLELNNSEHARYRFMSALFFNKQYADAVKEYESLKQTKFSNLYMERLAGYSYAELSAKDTTAAAKGLQALDNFFKMAGANFKYIPDDYRYRGKLLAATGNDSLALSEMQKAISLDSTKAGEVYTELADWAGKKKDYAGVISFLQKKKKATGSLSNNDWFDLGKAYYWSGQTKLREASELAAEYKKKKKPEGPDAIAARKQSDSLFVLADSAFVNLAALNPSWPVSHVWRGRANAMIDPDANTDSTKMHYEKVLSLLKPEDMKGSYKNYAVEAYEYLGYYYVKKKDEAKAKETWTKVKELDPTNEKMKLYFNPPKQKAQAGQKTQGK